MWGLVDETQTQEREWPTLIAQIALGDQGAFSRLYDQSSPQIYGLVLKIVQHHQTAEDVTLDVYTQVWKHAQSYDRQRGTPMAWLITLARTRAIDRLRATRMERVTESLDDAVWLPWDGASPEDESVASQRQTIVARALEHLSAEQREALTLAYFGGYSQTEIAEKLRLPLGTVKTRMRLGMLKLRDLLAPYEEGLLI
ncbi:MAG: sigma-70 family RNA polymerase sigma factor [Nitrospiraceae bacterium]